jgi:hypothetical protein
MATAGVNIFAAGLDVYSIAVLVYYSIASRHTTAGVFRDGVGNS